jgi:hypothetical protein
VGAYRGWIAAVLLAAFGVLGGPELLDFPRPAQAAIISTTGSHGAGLRATASSGAASGNAVSSGGTSRARPSSRRGPCHPSTAGQARSWHSAIDPAAPHRRWLPALPPSSQDHAAVVVRLSGGPAERTPVAPSAVRDRRFRHVGAWSLASLQTFRC